MENRRNFIKTIAGTAAFAALAPDVSAFRSPPQESLTVLFQGDSITDGNRTRNMDWNHVMGHGYAYTIASRLWFEYPDRGFHFFNRGVSGNRISHLSERWQTDTLDLKPDILSILIGINDTAAFLQGEKGLSVGEYETGYRNLLKMTLEKLPQTKFVLCEPFILPVGKVKENWDDYKTEVTVRQEVVKRLSDEFKAVHVPFQTAFDEALSRAPAEYWIWDGIHPMPAGHELMARFWLEKAGAALGI